MSNECELTMSLILTNKEGPVNETDSPVFHGALLCRVDNVI